MNIVYAIFFGIVQGLTEFLPISSSGHLVLLHEVFRIPAIGDISFDVALHLGTAAALLIFFASDLSRLYLDLWSVDPEERSRARSLVWWIAIGTAPAAVLGFLFESGIEQALRSPLIVGVGFVAVGILMLIVERIGSATRTMHSIGTGRSLCIGFAQALALIPGVSRAGSTITAAMALGVQRSVAAQFSFLLSIPIVLGAGLKKFLEVRPYLVADQWVLYSAGFVASAVSGVLVLRFFIRYVSTKKLDPFAWYRIIVGAAIMLWYAAR